uniref:ABC transporter domain-containing protein n=1 Tax=Caenorhabditis tropicalis TaxID=1561998 RepID=A0A1I7U8Q6_9PELO
MSYDIVTPDDALSSLVEDRTQSSSIHTDRTQESPPPAETGLAEIVDEDLDETENRFRLTSPAPPLEFLKREEKSKRSERRRKYERVLKWKTVTVEEVRRKKKKERKIILNEVSGRAYGGELTFIMGSSGAGKTTLLNVLTGRNKAGLKSTGHISMNGRRLNPTEMKQLSAYIQQEDVFIASQTVSEVLNFAVKMRSPDRLSKRERESLVESMLTSFGLTECANTRIGSVKVKGISRGEKKRLTIACELVSWFLGMVYLRVPIHRDHLLGIKGVIFGTLQMNNILYMMPSLISFWEDYPVVVREFQSNMYSPSAYFMARSFTDSILHLIYPIIFFFIIYFMTGLPVTTIGMSTFLTMCIAMSMIITSLSHAVVSLCGNVTVSLTVAPLISVPVMVFGGFLITVDAVPWYYKPLSYVSWYHYAFEAIMIAFFKDHGPIAGCQKVNPLLDFECSTGLKLITDQDFHVDNFWLDFVAVGGILVFWKVFGLACFVWRIKERV